jgi:hypothetical protein
MEVGGREGLIRSETMSRGANAQVNDEKMAGQGLYTGIGLITAGRILNT